MFRNTSSRQQADTITHAAVADTDQAVARKLRTLARQTTNGDVARVWNAAATAAEAGQLAPEIRADYARGTQFAG
ncbi:hypothetical protein OID55_10870 [Streptomyces sp. NBC_00715]|uniref:hypothetical protein n=1 Tax=Streptomyces sp. NBC_00715 TaxID=2975811 RepID=UPI00386F3B89